MGAESYKAMSRRDLTYGKYFAGRGIDIGCGSDNINRYNQKFAKMWKVRRWDMIYGDTDAQVLAGVTLNHWDFVHSSHSLEHMVSWNIALRNWISVVRPGGYIICTVPDWEMYERFNWPSRFNSDHKWSFTLGSGKHEFLVNLSKDLLESFGCTVEILKEIREGFDPFLAKTIDQTSGDAECAIEFVLRKC